MFFIMFLRFRTNWLEKLLCIPNWPRRNQTKCQVGQTSQLTTMHSSCLEKNDTGRVIFLSFFHVYRFQNLRIDNEFLPVPCKHLLSQMSQICDIYIYIYLYTIATPDDMDPNSLRLPRSVDFFLARLRTHRHRLNQMDLALSTHYTHWQSPVEWWNVARPFSITHLSIRIFYTYIFSNISPGDKRKDLGGTQVCAKDCGIQANPRSCSSASKDAWRWGWGGGWWTWGQLDPSFFFVNETFLGSHEINMEIEIRAGYIL